MNYSGGMLYPQSIKDNLIFRFEVGESCKDPNKQAAFIEFIKRDIAHFFNICLWTYDPRKKPAHRPFILYPYQTDYVHKFNESIVSGTDLLVEKTRDMGATWMDLGVFLYRWLLFGESFLVGSRKEELVDTLGDMDSHFERIRYMIRFLFPFLRPPKLNQSYMKIIHPDGNIINGESMNEGFSRQGRYNAILLDEFAHIHTNLADTIWQACGDSAKCRLPVSTPMGKYNKFAQLRFSGKIAVETLHWSKHPEKDQNWYEAQKERRSPTEIAQELDISYIASAGKAFYSGFQKNLHTGKFQVNTAKELILGWDFGWHVPACIVAQIDAKGRFIILREILGQDETIEKFGNRVRVYLNQEFPGMYHKSYGDPAGDQKSDKNEQTSIQILRGIGFDVKFTPSTYRQRKEIVERLLSTLIDGIPAFIVDDSCSMIIEGFEGGYRYPDAKNSGAMSECPLEDGVYEHCLSGDTKIRTLSGWETIQSLVGQSFYTYAYDSFSKRLIPVKAHSCKKTQTNVELWKLVFDEGELVATPDHLIMMRDGSYRQLKDLKTSDELMPFYEKQRSYKGHMIINLNDGSIVDEHRYVYNSVEFYGYGDTYNLEVDNYHNFPANGIMVHNSMNAWEYMIVNLFKAVERARIHRHYEPVEANAGFSFAS